MSLFTIIHQIIKKKKICKKRQKIVRNPPIPISIPIAVPIPIPITGLILELILNFRSYALDLSQRLSQPICKFGSFTVKASSQFYYIKICTGPIECQIRSWLKKLKLKYFREICLEDSNPQSSLFYRQAIFQFY